MKTRISIQVAPCAVLLVTALAAASGGARAAEARLANFAALNGTPVPAVVLTNATGMKVRIIAWGAAIQELDVPDRNGKLADVVLSYPDMTGFLADTAYFGATIGRYANRIAHGTFALDGQTYHVPTNDGTNSLHGGTVGFNKQLWTIGAIHSGASASATLHLTSRDGDQGYPGTLLVAVTFTLTGTNELRIAYAATTTKPTIVNLTNHSYFNLAGADSGRDILDDLLTIPASHYTPTNATLIPTGEIRSVAGTDFDFREPTAIGARIHDGSEPQLVMARGYDHNWVLDGGTTAAPKLAAKVEDPMSGRVLELLTTEPGVQFYTGNFLTGTVIGKDHEIYRQSDALTLEPQTFPDAPNHANFPSARLDPGQTYRQVSIFRFSAR